ncbi:MAG: class I SAM-dependent methyltransferase [Polyangiaceae bacterium]
MTTFGPSLAATYDATYATKDYQRECAIIVASAAAHGHEGPLTILDLGCGTGGHAIRLAASGHDVVAVDRSEAMLALARAKVSSMPSPPPGALAFVQGDLRSVRLGRDFDVVLMMFAVLGYQTTDVAVIDALATATAHARPGAIFVFDVWFDEAVEATGVSDRRRTIVTGEGEVTRRVEASCDTARRVATVDVFLEPVGTSPTAPTPPERHEVRYFGREEMRAFLDAAGWTLASWTSFPDVDRPADASTWNVLGVATRRG